MSWNQPRYDQFHSYSIQLVEPAVIAARLPARHRYGQRIPVQLPHCTSMTPHRCYGAPNHGATRPASRATDCHSSFSAIFAGHWGTCHYGDWTKEIIQVSEPRKHKDIILHKISNLWRQCHTTHLLKSPSVRYLCLRFIKTHVFVKSPVKIQRKCLKNMQFASFPTPASSAFLLWFLPVAIHLLIPSYLSSVTTAQNNVVIR